MMGIRHGSALGASVVALLAVGGIGFAAPGCSVGPETRPVETPYADAWEHVYIRVPASRLGEFEEGGGLLRPVDPSEVSGQEDVWFAYFPRHYTANLRAKGFTFVSPDRGDLSPRAVSPGETCPGVTAPVVDRFCPYTGTSYLSTCKRTIQKELEDVPKDFPPIGGVTYALSFPFGETFEGRKILAVRVGKTSFSVTDLPVPQLVVYAGQHAREWAGPESVMRIFRFLAQSWKTNTNGVRALLADVAVVIVPVANPDGYDYTHKDASTRYWRGTREPCEDESGNRGFGIDPNRNFEATWTEPGASHICLDDDNTLYRGPSASSAAETKALLGLLANDGLFGSYRTRFSLNVHTFGNLVLFPDGLSKDLSGSPVCTTDSNCTAPDHGVLQDLVGSELTEQMADEDNQRSYLSGQTYRHLYPIGGDSIATGVYGSPSRTRDPKFLSAMVELTNTPCAFEAEGMTAAQFDTVANRLRALVKSLTSKIPSIHSGSINPDFHLPHLHRRQAIGIGKEFPTIRVAAKAALGDVEILGAGATEQDDVRDGVTYRMWRTRGKQDPYVFPPDLPVCFGKKCATIALPDPGGAGKVNLCDAGMFPSAETGWSFTGDSPDGPQNECFWGYSGSGAARLTSSNWSIATMTKAKLVYSITRPASTKMNVLLSTNGFVNCSFDPGTGCRIVREYPFGESNHAVNGSTYRTEILDVSDFDHASQIRLRFDVKGSGAPSNVSIYDPILIGWKG